MPRVSSLDPWWLSARHPGQVAVARKEELAELRSFVIALLAVSWPAGLGADQEGCDLRHREGSGSVVSCSGARYIHPAIPQRRPWSIA